MKHQPPKDVIDHVCGMTVNPATAADEYTYEGKTYYFCAPVCRERFESDPDQYLTSYDEDQE